MARVNVVTPARPNLDDPLARALADALPYVIYTETPALDVTLVYTLGATAWIGRSSPVEVLGVGSEEVAPLSTAGLQALADRVDHIVCSSWRDRHALDVEGFCGVSVIAPVQCHVPRSPIRISVQPMAGFTGVPPALAGMAGVLWDRWDHNTPGQARPDYVLVPPPTSVQEKPGIVWRGLSPDIPVIAPADMPVTDRLHIAYRSADDLAELISAMADEASISAGAYPSDALARWIEAHDRLFYKLLTSAPDRQAPAPPVTLMLHGREAIARGGPSTRVPRLAQFLSAHGEEIGCRTYPTNIPQWGVVHLFNADPFDSALQIARRAKECGCVLIVSPIFLDMSEAAYWDGALPDLFRAANGGGLTDDTLMRAWLDFRDAEPPVKTHDSRRLTMISQILTLADHVVCLSHHEHDVLKALMMLSAPVTIVRNPVDATRFASASPALFRAHVGLDDFVLCVGRIEPRKNQLMLAHVLRGTGMPLVLLGDCHKPEYLALIEQLDGVDIRIVGHLHHDDPLLASAYAACRVMALPSWAEGAPLVALEAAAAGAALVLSDRSAEREYFDDRARYCDPADPASIRTAVTEAWRHARSSDRRSDLLDAFSWHRHADAIRNLYRARATDGPAPADEAEGGAPLTLVVDITTLVTAGLHDSITEDLVRRLMMRDNKDARYTVWNAANQRIDEVPAAALHRLFSNGSMPETVPLDLGSLAPVSLLLLSATLFAEGQGALQAYLARRSAGYWQIGLMVGDMTPLLRPDILPESLGMDFAEMLEISEVIVVPSQPMADRIRDRCVTRGVFAAPIVVCDLSAPLPAIAVAQPMEGLAERSFVWAPAGPAPALGAAFLIDLWSQRLCAGEMPPRLVIEGADKSARRRLSEDSALAQHVHLADNATPAGREWLYAHCLYTLFASQVEGTCAPAIRSAVHGKICLASEWPTTEAIAGQAADLLPCRDMSAWQRRCALYEGSTVVRQQRETQIRHSRVGASDTDISTLLQTIATLPRRGAWRENGDAVGDLSDQTPLPRFSVIMFGERADSNEVSAAPFLLSETWHAPEARGCWTRGRAGQLVLRFPSGPVESVRMEITATLSGFQCGDGNCAWIGISVEGTEKLRQGVDQPDPLTLIITHELPASQRPRPVRIRIQTPMDFSPAMVAASDDERRLGIFVSRIVCELVPASGVDAFVDGEA